MKDVRALIHTRKHGVTDLDIEITEQKIDTAFPEQYKELFKMVINAEIGELILFPVKDPKNLPKTWDDVVRQNGDCKVEGSAPDFIAIGNDGTGDKLCYRIINGKMEDRVFIWFHETKEIEAAATNLREFIIANSEIDEND